MDGGKAESSANLEPRECAFFCFVSDKQTGGPPHVVKGMVSEVEVTDSSRRLAPARAERGARRRLSAWAAARP